MIRGTTFQNGLMAGAARLGTCAVPHPHAGIAAPTCDLAGSLVPMHGWQWIEGAYTKRFRVFATDRSNPRPPERST